MDWKSPLSVFLTCILCWCWTEVESSIAAVCDEFYPSIYCNCRTRKGDTTVVCFVTGDLSIDDDIWPTLGRVEDMVSLDINAMQGVRLSYVPMRSLENSSSLRVLELKHLSLGVLESGAVSGLPELRELRLDGSEITELQPGAISDLPRLKVLSLSENMLEELLADSLERLDELEELFLDQNNISRVEGCAFCNLQNLKNLELWGNRITDLTDYMFRGLRYLTRLDLYRNRIRILNDRVFHSMPKLVEIDLKDNLIAHVAPNTFQGLKNLQRLMLNSNRIKVLPDHVFKPLPNLRNLDLYNNELETLPVGVVESITNINDENFSFSFKDNNPLKCDCGLAWVPKYLASTKSHQFLKELSQLKCTAGDRNGTLLTVHTLEMDCEAGQKRPGKHRGTHVRHGQQQHHQGKSARPAVKATPFQVHGRNDDRTTTHAGDDQPRSEHQDRNHYKVRTQAGGDQQSPSEHQGRNHHQAGGDKQSLNEHQDRDHNKVRTSTLAITDDRPLSEEDPNSNETPAAAEELGDKTSAAVPTSVNGQFFSCVALSILLLFRIRREIV